MNLEFHSPAARGLRRYVRLVAAGLAPAAEHTAVHWTHPVRAYLALPGRLRWFPGRDVALTWDERHGWAMVLAARPTESLAVLRYLGADLLPAPGDVAAFTGRLFGDELTGEIEPPPRGNALELTARLATYAGPRRGRHRAEPHPVHLHGVITAGLADA